MKKKKRSVPLQMVCRRDICSCRLAGVARSDCTPQCNTGAVDILVAHLSQGPHCALFDLATLFLCVHVFFILFCFPLCFKLKQNKNDGQDNRKSKQIN